MRYRVEYKQNRLRGIAVQEVNGRYTIKLDNDTVRDVAGSTFKRWYIVLEELENKVVPAIDTQAKIKEIERRAEEEKAAIMAAAEEERIRKRNIRADKKKAMPKINLKGLAPSVTEQAIRNEMRYINDGSIIMVGRFTENVNSKFENRYKYTDTFDYLGFKLVAVYTHTWTVDVKLFSKQTGHLLIASTTGSFAPIFKVLGLDKEQISIARKEVRENRKAWSSYDE